MQYICALNICLVEQITTNHNMKSAPPQFEQRKLIANALIHSSLCAPPLCQQNAMIFLDSIL